MDVIEIRHRNLLLLITQMQNRGITKNKDIAQAIGGFAPAYLSQMKGGKKIGEDTARKIEEATRKPKGWMDQPQWTAAYGGVADSTDVDQAITMEQLMQLLPPDERALLENYRAAGDAGKAVLEAAAVAAAKPSRPVKRR